MARIAYDKNLLRAWALALGSLVFLAGGVAMLAWEPGASPATPGTPSAPDGTIPVSIGGKQYTVELATTPAQRAKGLMGRTRLPQDRGMLFLGDGTSPPGMWMKDTLIPLDILFLDADFRLVDVYHGVLPCKADPCPVYRPDRPATHVLELARGESARRRLRVGDQLEVPPHLRPR